MRVLSVRRGHAPNCSSAGSVVGVALASSTAFAAVLGLWAHRFATWRQPPGGGPPAPMRQRAEGFGALLALPGLLPGTPGAILALDAPVPEVPLVGATVDVPGALRAPLEAHVSLTSHCPVRCTGCYVGAGPDGVAADAAGLRRTLDELAAMGTFEVAFGGGESALGDDVLELARYARGLGLVPNLTTSGLGVTAERARAAAGLFGQLNVSIDGVGPVYAAVRGWDGEAVARRALGHLRDAGARTGANTLVSRALFADPAALDALGDALVADGAAEWQWLRVKPAGRARTAPGLPDAGLAATPAQLLTVWPALLRQEARTGLTMRVDCAMVPFLAAHAVPVERMVALGVSGCVGGHALWARDARGGMAPCSFAAATPAAGGLAARWADDPELAAWRAHAAAPPEPCVSCAWQGVCRGGCRIVAEAVTGDRFAPDPECPRVREGA